MLCVDAMSVRNMTWASRLLKLILLQTVECSAIAEHFLSTRYIWWILSRYTTQKEWLETRHLSGQQTQAYFIQHAYEINFELGL